MIEIAASKGARPSLRTALMPQKCDLTNARHLARFRQTQVVVLSPHFDDACFSLCVFLKNIGSGTLINVFTRGCHLPRENICPRSSLEVFAIRDAEDEAFAQQCGFVRANLNCDEPILRSRRVSDLSGIEEDLEQITAGGLSVLKQLAEAQPGWGRGYLFAPLGVGSHCNHRAVNEFVIRNLSEISKDYDILFYEELPYSSSLIDRIGG